jgi:hypothetical protein
LRYLLSSIHLLRFDFSDCHAEPTLGVNIAAENVQRERDLFVAGKGARNDKTTPMKLDVAKCAATILAGLHELSEKHRKAKCLKPAADYLRAHSSHRFYNKNCI